MRTSWLALVASVAYATARYNIFKGVPWSDWSAYTLNKAFGLAALFLLVLSALRKRSAEKQPNDRTLFMAGVFASTHVVLSLTLFSPAYYPNLFVQDKLTAAAGLSMMLGAVAAAAMTAGSRPHAGQNANGGGRSLAILAFAAGVHAMLQGFAGWFAPSTWPGMMPPITLISFLLGSAPVAVAWRAKPRA